MGYGDMSTRNFPLIVACLLICTAILSPVLRWTVLNGVIFNSGHGIVASPLKNVSSIPPYSFGHLTLYFFLLALFIGCVWHAHATRNKNQSIAPRKSHQHKHPLIYTTMPAGERKADVQPRNIVKSCAGVRGWLLLLVLSMAILVPVCGAGRISAQIVLIERLEPGITVAASWQGYKTAVWWAFSAMAMASACGATLLLLGKESWVVWACQIIIWFIGPFSTLLLGGMLPYVYFSAPDVFDPLYLGSLISAVAGATLWSLYLGRSRRVRDTLKARIPDQRHPLPGLPQR